MAAFNLTAELNLRGPSNLNQVVSNIRRQLSTVTLDLNINPNTSRGIQAVTSNVRNLSAALRDAQNNAAALSSTLSTLVGNINNVGSAAGNINNAFNRLNTQTRGAATGLGDAASEMEQFGRQSALAIRRFAAFSVATGGIYTLVRAISSAYSEFVNFNREFVRLQQVTNSSASGLSGLADEITRLSTGLGVSSSELLNVSTTLAQAGLSATQTKTALEALAKSALAPSFDSLNDTVEGSIALMRQFGISAGELEGALGSINAVAAKFAVEAGDIITAIQRTGGVFATASKGVSEGTQALNEFIAVFTSVRATTRESAETIATGLRTIFTRIQRGGTIQSLKDVGIVLTDLEGKFVGPFEAIKRLSEGLASLDPRDLRFSQIVEELGGFRQIGKVIPLIQQFATAQQALGVAQRGAGSLTADSAKAQEALAIRINKVREEFVALIRDIGQTQSFQKFVDVSLSLASALISVASSAKEVLPALTAIAAIRAIPAIGQFARGFTGGIGRQRRFASGGMVPGSGNRDTVPAMLTPGEFVIRKKAVESIGVDKLAALNRNGGGAVPQYFNSGGLVQKFAGGGGVQKLINGEYVEGSTLAALKELTRDFLMPRSRKGGRRKISFTTQKAVAISKQIPPELLEQIEKEGRLVSGTGLREDLPKGSPGLVVDKVVNVALAKAKRRKAGQLKKTQGALTFSAAGLQRGPRPPEELRGKKGPDGEFSMKTPAYLAADPEFARVMGIDTGIKGGFLKQFEAQAKQEIFTSPKSLLDRFPQAKNQLESFRASLEKQLIEQQSKIKKDPKTIKSLQDQIKKTSTALQDIDQYIEGGSPANAGRASHFAWSMRQAIPESKEFADGGMVQKFMAGEFVKKQKRSKVPSYANQKEVNKALNSGAAIRTFGLVGIKGGSGQGSYFNQTLVAKPKGMSPLPVKIQVGTLEEQETKDKTGFAQSIDNDIKKLFNLSIRKTARKLGSLLKSEVKPQSSESIDKIVNNSGFQQVVGSVFEGALNMIGAPYFEKKQSTKSMDFPFGLGGVSSLFNIEGNIPTDATRTVGSGGKGPGRMIGQIERFLAAEAKGLYKLPTETFTASELRNLASRARNSQTAEEINNILFSTGKQSGKKAIPLFFTYGKKAGIVPTGFEDRLRENDETVRRLRAGGFFDSVIEEAKANGGMIKHFASGGPSGSDTVPAMLTPGEFVINKEAASRIGSANLHKLNHADKIKGFNKGGAVGNIQHFAEGGSVGAVQIAEITAIVGGLAFLTRSLTGLDRIIERTATTFSRFNSSVDMGLPRTGQGTARGTGRRDFTNQGQMARQAGISGYGQTADAFGIAFAGAGLATTVGENIGGTTGRSISEVGTTVSTIFSLAAAFGLLSNPVTAFGTLLVSVVPALFAWKKAVIESTIEQEQKKISANSQTIERSFEAFTKSNNQTQKAQNRDIFLNTLAKNISSEQIIKKNQISAASPTFNIGGTKETLVNAFDFNKLGQQFAEAGKDSSDKILDFINQGLQDKLDLETIFKQLEQGGISRESSRTAIGLASVKGQDIAQTQARLAVTEQELGRDSPQAKVLRNILKGLLDQVNNDFKNSANQLANVNQAVIKVNQSFKDFLRGIENLSSAVSAASAIFQEKQRQIDIVAGSSFSGQARIAPVSRLNEEVLSNPKGFSNELIKSEIQRTSESLGVDKDITQKATSAALSQKVLETDLTQLLNSITQAEKEGSFGNGREDILASKLEPILEKAGVDKEFRGLIVGDITKNLSKFSTSDTSLGEILDKSEPLKEFSQNNNKAMQDFSNITRTANNTLDTTVNRLNQFVEATEKATDAQIKVEQIRLEGINQLDEAVGRRVSLQQKNAISDTTIQTATRTIGPDGKPIQGTGTTNIQEIGRRLEIAEKQRVALELKPQRTQDDFKELGRLNAQINQYENALKKVTTETTKFSNALTEIQKLRQERENKQNAFLDFASNANDPEFLMNFTNDVGSLVRVLSGRGQLFDIQGARRAFETRLSTLPEGERDSAKTEFTKFVADILRIPPELQKEFGAQFFGANPAEKAAEDAAKKANADMEAAAQILAKATTDSSSTFYTNVTDAGKQVASDIKTSLAAQQQNNNQPPAGQNPIQPGNNHNGGLIYANKGRYVNFEPKGTDTVPAMLTPGEFVVNAKATKQNLGLLQQINKGGKIGGFSRGGVVYLADGGSVPGQRKMSQEEKVYKQKRRERIQQRNSQMANSDRNRAAQRNLPQQPIEETPTDPTQDSSLPEDSPSMILLRQAQAQDAAAEANKIALEEKYAEEQRLRDKKFQTEIDNIPSRLQAEKDKKIAEAKARSDARVAELAAREAEQDNKAQSLGYKDRFDMDRANREKRKQDKLKMEADQQESIANGIASLILIDPITRQILNERDPSDIQAELDRLNEIKQKRIKEIGSEELLQRADPQLLARIRELETTKRGTEIAISQDQILRAKEIEDTNKEYQELDKSAKSGKLRPQDAQRYARLSLVRGVKPKEIAGGRTLEAERELRDEGIGEENRRKLEKKELKKFKEELKKEKQTSFYDKVTGELAARAGVGAEKLTGSKAVGVAAQFGVGLLGGVADPTNFASPAGLSYTAGFLADTAAGVGGVAAGLATGDQELTNQAFAQAAFTVGLGAASRGLSSIRGRKLTTSAKPLTADEAAVAKGLTRAADTANRGIEGFGNKLTDFAEAGINAAATNKPLLPQLKVPQRLTDALEARRIARETRRGQGALTKQALAEAEEKALAAEGLRRAEAIDAEMATRQANVSASVTRGQESATRMRAMGLEPISFSDEAATSAVEASTTIATRARSSAADAAAKGSGTTTSSIALSTEERQLAEEALRNFTSGGTQRGTTRTRSSFANPVEPFTPQPATQTISQTARSSSATEKIIQEAKNSSVEIAQKETSPISLTSKEQNVLAQIKEQELNRKVARLQDLIRSGNPVGSDRDIYEILMKDPEVVKRAGTMLRRPISRANGGIIYASQGSLIPYQPHGTDTVPAMLTPGEFVINKAATQRNLPLLKAINNNQVQGYSKGGQVNYLQNGGTASGGQSGGSSSFVLDSSAFTAAVADFNRSVGSLSSLTQGLSQLANLSTALGGINTAAATLSTASSLLNGAAGNLASPISAFTAALNSVSSVLTKVPSEIKLVASGSIPVLVTVEVNGGEGLEQNLQPFADEIYNKVADGIRRATNGNLNIEVLSTRGQ